jgi:hypothetical protein
MFAGLTGKREGRRKVINESVLEGCGERVTRFDGPLRGAVPVPVGRAPAFAIFSSKVHCTYRQWVRIFVQQPRAP